MSPRMNPPRGPNIGPMGPGGYGPSMRGPPPGMNPKFEIIAMFFHESKNIYTIKLKLPKFRLQCFLNEKYVETNLISASNVFNENIGGPGMPPGMGMASGGRPQWQPGTSTPMNYSSSSPGNYGVSRYHVIFY